MLFPKSIEYTSPNVAVCKVQLLWDLIDRGARRIKKQIILAKFFIIKETFRCRMFEIPLLFRFEIASTGINCGECKQQKTPILSCFNMEKAFMDIKFEYVYLSKRTPLHFIAPCKSMNYLTNTETNLKCEAQI